jgi:hypothetical protein
MSCPLSHVSLVDRLYPRILHCCSGKKVLGVDASSQGSLLEEVATLEH